MKLPESNIVAATAPDLDVLDVQIVDRPSLRRRFPVESKSRMADLLTGESLMGERMKALGGV